MNKRCMLKLDDFSNEEILEIISQADVYREKVKKHEPITDLNGYVIGSLFFQPSSRTRAGFETAILRMGAKCVSFSDIKNTRCGDYYQESMSDFIRVVSEYVDAIILRYQDNNIISEINRIDNAQVISAGIGSIEHPIHSLTLLYQLFRENKLGSNIKFGMVGDLGIRSLRGDIKLLSRFGIRNFYHLPAPNTKIPDDLETYIYEHNVIYKKVDSVNQMLKEVDVILSIGINHPDHTNLETSNVIEKKPTPPNYQITFDSLKYAKDDLIILHPMPRTDDISKVVDSTKYAKYFDMSANAMYVEMSTLKKILKDWSDS